MSTHEGSAAPKGVSMHRDPTVLWQSTKGTSWDCMRGPLLSALGNTTPCTRHRRMHTHHTNACEMDVCATVTMDHNHDETTGVADCNGGTPHVGRESVG